MILLDTNYLIKALAPGTDEAADVRRWIEQEKELVTSVVCWYEFLCGPVDIKGKELMQSIVKGRIIPFAADQAVEAARLFYLAGRKRSLRVDSMIAAAALLNKAVLATDNRRDFSSFVKQGLVVI
ncbi:type II toxin-antitoxin system VapC family toxin [Marispirochaeta sp.]|jgi:predicted nucleic acid-binding protein|uniref:type II toxin-antitoxin system VapC family toxin n=1 Tax=Marispirochaeta sp. TaxID=2038653 RepID=UPI0029C972A8|nr:type II toxin-antitoxin system VapC family toxin [Marispirochaeta sp.]